MHHCNYATIQLQQRLVTSYCSWEAAGQQLTRTQLQRKIQLCKNVMDCLAKVDAGNMSRPNMIMLYIVCFSLAMTFKKRKAIKEAGSSFNIASS